MTVRDLIELLEQENEDAIVYVDDCGTLRENISLDNYMYDDKEVVTIIF